MTDLRKLLEAATKGPWKIDRCNQCSVSGIVTAGGSDILVGHQVGDEFDWNDSGAASHSDAALIVAAVNALPDLLDIVEAAKRHRDAKRALVESNGYHGYPEFLDAEEALTAALAQWEKRNG